MDNKYEPKEVKLAVKKMLEVLGLHITRRRVTRKIDIVSESLPGKVRVFKDCNGNVMSIRINDSNRKDFAGVFPSIGTWTYFKNDDQATFDAFTKSIREFSIDFWQTVSNPFFGCCSLEEVLVKCDLMS